MGKNSRNLCSHANDNYNSIHENKVAHRLLLIVLTTYRKEDLEAQLSATEKDIEALSKPHVYVVGEENTSEV